MDLLFRVGVTQIVKGIGVIGIKPQDLLHLRDHLLKVSHFIVECTKLIMEIDIFPVLGQAFLESFEGPRQLLLFFEEGGENEREVHLFRFGLNRFLHDLNGLSHLFLFA